MQKDFYSGNFGCSRDTFQEVSVFFPFIKHNIFYVSQTEVSEKKKTKKKKKRNIFVLGEIHRVRKHAKRCTEKLSKSVSLNSMDKIQSKGGMQHSKSPFQENKKPSSLNIVTGLDQNVKLNNILSF